jgi:hypothetical protein
VENARPQFFGLNRRRSFFADPNHLVAAFAARGIHDKFPAVSLRPPSGAPDEFLAVHRSHDRSESYDRQARSQGMTAMELTKGLANGLRDIIYIPQFP